MAEVIAALGVIASIAQLADYGFKLSVKLFTYSQAVSKADQSIREISNDVSLTSTVLQELSQIIKDDESRIVSNSALEATQKTVKECFSVFEQLNEALDKSLSAMGKLDDAESKRKTGRGIATLERLKWPFKQPKMELLRSNLDRLKGSLTLMLQVLSYARDVSSRKLVESSLEYQKHIIEQLARSEREMRSKYDALQVMIDNEDPPPSFSDTTNTVVGLHTAEDPAPPPSPPIWDPRVLTDELMLCSQLLDELIGHHLERPTATNLGTKEFKDLRAALNKPHVLEKMLMAADMSDDGVSTRLEAVQILYQRLTELASASLSRSRRPLLARNVSSRRTSTQPMPAWMPGRAEYRISPRIVPDRSYETPTMNYMDSVPVLEVTDPYLPESQDWNIDSSDEAEDQSEEFDDSKNDESYDGDESVANRLLSEWTTLPAISA